MKSIPTPHGPLHRLFVKRPDDRLIEVPRDNGLTKAHDKESDGRDCLSDMSLARNHPDFLRRSLREFGYQGET